MGLSSNVDVRYPEDETTDANELTADGSAESSYPVARTGFALPSYEGSGAVGAGGVALVVAGYLWAFGGTVPSLSAVSTLTTFVAARSCRTLDRELPGAVLLTDNDTTQIEAPTALTRLTVLALIALRRRS